MIIEIDKLFSYFVRPDLKEEMNDCNVFLISIIIIILLIAVQTYIEYF